MSAAFEIICNTADEQRWLEHRNSGIGASEIAILLGASEWSSNLDLYYRKVGDLPEEERDDTELMQWGRLLEGAIRDELARRAEVTILDAPPRLLRSTEHTWAIATPDALTTNGEPVEVKNLSHGYNRDEWDRAIPEKYYLQCQHQMLVTGAQRCLFGALCWGCELIWEWVPRDEVAIRRILKAGSEFWAHVETRTPPLSDGHPRAAKILGRLANNDNAIELYEPDIQSELTGWQAAKVRHAAAAAEEKAAKKALDAKRDHLAQRLGEHRSAATVTGWSFRWKTTERKGYVVQPTSFDTFEIKAPKEAK